MVFCPPDFMNWSEARSWVSELAERIYLADALELLDENPQIALKEDIKPSLHILALNEHPLARKRLVLKDKHFEIELIAFWIMNRLDEDYSAAICTNQGNLLRANHAILFHPDQFFYFYLRFPLRSMTELSAIYQEYDAGRMNGSDLWDRYCCIDGETGLIKEKNQTKARLIQYFGGRPDYESDGGIFENYVKPFFGSYVVFDPEVYPETLYDFFDSIVLANKHWARPETAITEFAQTRKRGPKPSPAKQEFFVRYPDGLPDKLSAEAVAEELKAAGFPITGRSIQNYDRERKNRK